MVPLHPLYCKLSLKQAEVAWYLRTELSMKVHSDPILGREKNPVSKNVIASAPYCSLEICEQLLPPILSPPS